MRPFESQEVSMNVLKTAAVLSAVFAVSVLWAEGSKETAAPKKVKLSVAYNWMGQDSKALGWEGRLKEFQEKYKDQVELEMIPVAGGGTGIRTKIQTDFAANNAADFFIFYDGKEVLPYVRAGYIADITDLITKDPAMKDRFIAGTLDTTTFDGKVYGVPMSQCTVGLFANRDLFKKYGLKYPVTVEDFEAVSKVFRANGIAPIALGNKSNGYAHLLFSAFADRFLSNEEFAAAGNRTGGKSFLDPGWVKTANLIMDFTRKEMFIEGVNSIDAFQAVALYSEGKAAMLFAGSWNIGNMSKEIIESTDPILLPVIPGETQYPGSVCGFTEMSLYANKSIQNDPQRSAWIKTFIDFVTAPAFVKNFAETSNALIPSVRGVELDPAVANSLLVKSAKLYNGAPKRAARITSYLTPSQTAVLRDAVARMLMLADDSPIPALKMLEDKMASDAAK
jgi:raffinose/stachyose/melibiose transport system substrate-binding protein